MLTLLAELKNENAISELNYHFAKLIDRKQQPYHYSPLQQNLAVLLACVVSFNVMQGHSCVHLNTPLSPSLLGLNEHSLSRDIWADILQKIGHLSPLEWQSALADHIAFSHDPNHVAPLLFQQQSLYFYRYWQDERQIADYLQQAVSQPNELANLALDRAILARFFPENPPEIDWQKIAVATALQKKFCLISGGPGTGKTRTVAILLAALQLKQREQGLPLLQIALAAPTGKAAARLKESITVNLMQLALPVEIKTALPAQASTIHSLIGISLHHDLPRHHAKNRLHLDLLVVDEASMIDLFVMKKLLNALKPSTRLIMLGDKDQLTSVEAGSIMNELGQFMAESYSPSHSEYLSQVANYPLNATPNLPAICDCLCHLRKSFRFNEQSGIGHLAKAINAQQAVKSWQLFANYADLALHCYPSPNEFASQQDWQRHCVNLVLEQAVSLYRPYLQAAKARKVSPQAVTVQTIFALFQQVRLLSALRVGELGAEQLNQQIADALHSAHLVQFKQRRENYIGKPILITENAPHLHIFSGDIGIVLPDEMGKLRVYFETEINGKLLHFSPSRLPANEPAYVMTVHKSQGSEFAHTLLVMPQTFSPVLSKALLYTAVTRAKSQFTLFSNEKVWKQGVNRDIQRQSGLRDQLLLCNKLK